MLKQSTSRLFLGKETAEDFPSRSWWRRGSFRASRSIANRMAAAGENLCSAGALDGIIQGLAYRQNETLASFLQPLATRGWSFPFQEGIKLAILSDPPVVADENGRQLGEWKGHLVYELTPQVADNSGLFCYTPYIPVKPDTYYQCSFRVLTEGPKVILFVKGYRDLPIETPRNDEKGEEVKTLRQEVFKHQIRFYGPKSEWGTLTTKPFLPRSVRHEHVPQFLRVQLYAYHPAGVVCFDDVVVKECRETK